MTMELQPVGAQHPSVKQLIALQRTGEPDRFAAEGLWAHEVLLDAGVVIETFLVCPDALRTDLARAIVEPVARHAEHTYEISAKTLARVTDRDDPDGLVSVARMPTWTPDSLAFGDTALVLVADGIETPGNLGTLIRTLDACAADALVLTNRRTRLTNPKVFRASHGMSVRVPSVDFDGPSDAAQWLRDNGFTIYLADANAEVNYRKMRLARRITIVMGNERYGISKPWYDGDFEILTIPMLGAADSLNVSVSASVLLYEARAQLNDW